MTILDDKGHGSSTVAMVTQVGGRYNFIIEVFLFLQVTHMEKYI